MKKSVLTILAIALVALGMSSCATHSKIMNMDNNMVILDSANFEYVKTVKESASATYVLGFCGGNPEQKAIDKVKELLGNDATDEVAKGVLKEWGVDTNQSRFKGKEG